MKALALLLLLPRLLCRLLAWLLRRCLQASLASVILAWLRCSVARFPRAVFPLKKRRPTLKLRPKIGLLRLRAA